VPTQCQWAWHIKQAGNEDSLSTDEAIHLWINALVNHQSINVEYGLVEPKEIRASRLLAEEDMRLQNLRQRDANITTERAQCKTPSGRWFHIFGPKAEDIIRSINNISTPLADVLKSSLAFLKDQPDDQLVRANLGQRIDYEAQKFSQQNFSSETEFEQKFNAALNELKQLNEQCLFELSDGFVVKVAQKHAIEAFDNAAQLKPSQQPHILFMAEQLSKLPSHFYSH
jgi:hypothetical protein